MKNYILLLIPLFCIGCAHYTIPAPSAENIMSRLDIYERAEIITGTSSVILRGIAYTESSYLQTVKHRDPLDRGIFGLHEQASYHIERAKKWGEYDADNPGESAIIAGFLFQENLRILGSEDMAIAAHYQGPTGVRKNGPCRWYIARVRNAK